MAADLIIPQQSHHQAFFNQNSSRTSRSSRASVTSTCVQPPSHSHISPLSTSHTPQSPKSHYSNQVRHLYIPAVLRPNKYPSKPSRPESSSDVAPDSALSCPSTPNSGYLRLAGLGALNRLSRRSTDEAGISPTDENENMPTDNLDIFPVVTDLPTRRHWKPDSDSTICDEPTCKNHFSYFTRRHHCRRCGNIFCNMHSFRQIPLDQDAEYNPRAPALSRACNHCYREYNAWRSRTNSQSSSTASSEANLHMSVTHGHQRSKSHQVAGSSTATPVAASPAPIDTANSLHNTPAPEAPASVPSDWNWSTF